MPTTNFRPETDGFAFENSFDLRQAAEDDRLVGMLRDLADSDRPRSVTRSQGDSPSHAERSVITARSLATFGLCGGMVFTALDFYSYKYILPRGRGVDDQPDRAGTKEGDDLYVHLWVRQLASVSSNLGTFVSWMKELASSGGEAKLLALSEAEWEELKLKLDAGRPQALGLVGQSERLTDQHFVVAHDYRLTGPSRGEILLYDPNWPHDPEFPFRPTLQFDFSGSGTISYPGPYGYLRGFFVARYSADYPHVTVGLKDGLDILQDGEYVDEAKINSDVAVEFVVSNFGYCPTPVLKLCASEQPLAGQSEEIIIGYEPSIGPIPNGATRNLAITHRLNGPAEVRVYGPRADLGTYEGVKVIKKLPPWNAGTSAKVSLAVVE